MNGGKIMQNKKIMVILIIMLLIFTATVSSANIISSNKSDIVKSTEISKSSTNAKWTLMMYCAFDNHRDAEKEFTFDIFKSVGSSEDVNLVALVDTRSVGDTNYCYIQQDLVIPLSWYESESDMGHPDTLKRFIELSKNQYPADHYALFVLSTHGSSWQGLGGDTHGTGSSSDLSLINMKDYKDILTDVTNNGSDKLDVAAFEICITGGLEVACQISPYVNYMLSTEEHGFGGEDGLSEEGTVLEWNYTSFLNELRFNPDMTPEEFVSFVVGSYQAGTYVSTVLGFNMPEFYPIKKYYTTLSATNLSKSDQLKNDVSTLAEKLTDNLPDVKPNIRKAREDTREYGILYPRFWWLPTTLSFGLAYEPWGYDCFIDVYDFSSRLREEVDVQEVKDACTNVMNSLDEAIIASESLPTDPSYGLHIYFPQLRCQYDQSIWKGMKNPTFRNIPVKYEELDFSEDNVWDEFLKTYLNILQFYP